jgi:IS30 family transposase
MKTNYESLYQWIYYDRPDLVQYLVRGHKKRHKRAVSKKSRAGKIPRRAGISQRPQEINSRREAGHWEAGTVVSRAGKHAAAVFVERKYRLYPAVMRKSITYDNGLENALHNKINGALGTKSYFCKPYHSWEKGSVENRNGILRRFFPKKHNWNLTSQRQLNKIIAGINSTPVKCLRFRTPAEAFASSSGVALTC